MEIPINTTLSSFTLHLKLKANTDTTTLRVAIDDPRYPNTFFVKRKLRIDEKHQGERTLRIPMPISSTHLRLRIYDKIVGDSSFTLKDMQISPLGKKAVWASAEQHRFMDFACWFAMRAGYSSEGFYRDKSGRFYLQYLTELSDELGLPLITPARIQRGKPFVQIARRQFIHYSLPVRILILAHEGCHYFLDTRSEQRADFCGLRYYLDAGFPKIEAVYAITKVFRFFDVKPGKEQVERAKAAIAFIRDYDSKTVKSSSICDQ